MWLEDIADSGCNAVGLDWTVDIDSARGRIGERVALGSGNVHQKRVADRGVSDVGLSLNAADKPACRRVVCD